MAAHLMLRPPRLIAVACIAVVLLTAATPAIWDAVSVVFEPIDPIFGLVVIAAGFRPDTSHVPAAPFIDPLESRGPPAL